MGSTSAASSQVMGGGIKPGMGIALSTPPLTEDIEITGPLAATFHVSSESEDMDLFLTLRNFDADGNEIMETGQQGTPVPVAKGWLRASHRELDPELSLPYRPYHKHTRRLFLKPGEIVKVEVEIWPTSMVFRKGHRIQLDVQPRDGVGSQSYLHYHADYNTGTNTIYAGGECESYLLLPVIPKRECRDCCLVFTSPRLLGERRTPKARSGEGVQNHRGRPPHPDPLPQVGRGSERPCR